MHRVFIAAFACVLATASQSAPRQADAPERAADASDKIICKRFLKTGSLVDAYRTCKSKSEWARERDNLQEITRAYSCRQSDAHAEPCK